LPPPPNLFPYTTLFRSSARSEETYVSNVVESGRKLRPPSSSANEDSASSSQRSSWFPPRISTCWLKLMRCCSSCRNVPGRNDCTDRKSTRLNSSHQLIS